MSLATLLDAGLLDHQPTQDEIESLEEEDVALLGEWWASPSGTVGKAFDPNEPRDDHGRWTEGGASGNGAMHGMFDRVSKPDGGFTYQPRTGEEPSTGFAVSIYPERSLGIDADKLQFSDLVDYAAKNQDLFEKADHFIGAWHDPASHRVFLDVSVVKSTAREAETLARGHDQIAYFDLGGGKSVTVNPEATSGGQSKAGAVARIGQGQDLDAGAPRHALREADREEADGAGAGSRASTTRAVVRIRPRPRKRGVTYVDKFNPYHRPSGPGGGQFTSGDEGGAGAGPPAGGYGPAAPRAGVEHTAALMPKSVNPSIIPRDKALSPRLREVETKFAEQLAADPQGAWAEYIKLNDTMGGKVLAVDVARELSPDYQNDKSLSAAVHEPASWFIKQAYAARLQQPPGPGEEPAVMFLAGGTGAGKTTAIRIADAGILDKAQIIYDGNLSGLPSSRGKIQQALDANKGVVIAYIDRDPVTAFTAGIFPDGPKGSGVLVRAMRTGRTVPIEAHIATHTLSRSTVPTLAAEFSGNKRFDTFFVNNNGSGKSSATRVKSFSDLPKPNYNSLRTDLYAALERAHSEGRISEAVYRGTRHAPEEPAAGD